MISSPQLTSVIKAAGMEVTHSGAIQWVTQMANNNYKISPAYRSNGGTHVVGKSRLEYKIKSLRRKVVVMVMEVTACSWSDLVLRWR